MINTIESKQRVVRELVTTCRTGSRRPKKVKKGIDQCDVTFETMWKLMENQNWECAVYGHKFLLMPERWKVEETNKMGLNRLFLPSVDRIDNNKGYTMDNIRIVTAAYNNVKNIYNDNEVSEWINSIKNNK